MRTYSNSIVLQFDTADSGNAGAGKPVTVYGTGTVNKADLFDINNIPITNPFNADEMGNYTFRIEDGTYDIVIDQGLPTQTVIAQEQIANIVSAPPSDPEDNIKNFKTLNEAVIDLSVKVNFAAIIKERVAGEGGGGIWDFVDATTVTPNTFNIVQCTGVPSLALVLREKKGYKSVLQWGYSDSLTADNDAVNAEFFKDIKNGDYIDFHGRMFRIMLGVTGIPSSGANPATDNAADTDEISYLYQKNNITFSSGGLYAANASASGTKYYFPSTLSLRECEQVHFESGSLFEAKGESWGDSDASFPESFNRRGEFLATNGGHAIVLIACKSVTGTPSARFCGSVASIYFSSCDDIRLDSPFSNPASLGYAPYAADAWAGDLTYTGFDQFVHQITNPTAYRETDLLQREDGVTFVGSNVYCGKGGVVTEDRDIQMYTTGGFLADMYANASAKSLGYAFGAGSGSINHSVGCTIRRCQQAGFMLWSVDAPATLEILDMDAIVGLTGCFLSNQSFGIGNLRMTGRLQVNATRLWAGETEELANTSVVACKKTVSEMNVVLDLIAGPEIDLLNNKVGSIFTIINNITDACYGGVTIEGGSYETSGYLIRSAGWGGASANSRKGLVIKDGVRIMDTSAVALDPYINYQNQSPTSVFTYLYHDLEGGDISSESGFRSLDGGYTITGAASLIEKFLFPRKMGVSTYLIGSGLGRRPKETMEVEFTSVIGLSGSDSRMDFVMSDGRAPSGVCYIQSDVGLDRVLFVYTPTVAGPLRCNLLLENDVRADYTPLVKYTIFGG